MLIAITAISILAITGFIWLLNRILSARLRSRWVFKVCSICVGVSGTWLWMLAAKLLGYEIDLIVPAVLMGGSVVGITNQIEKRFSLATASAGTLLLWKTLFIPAGFIAAYSIISLAVDPLDPSWWILLIAMIIVLVMLTLAF